MIVDLPDHLVAAHGETVFTGLIKVLPGGELQIFIPVSETPDPTASRWLEATLSGDSAAALGQALAVYGAGGGSA